MKKIVLLISLLFVFAACGAGSAEHNSESNYNPTEEAEETEEVGEVEEIAVQELFYASTGRALDPSMPSIALTFDDGPNTTISVQILDALEERGLVATFFVIGQEINDESAEVMRRGFALGNEYAPHSWDWHSTTSKNKEGNIETIIRTRDRIEEILGEDARSAFHRPHGSYPNAAGVEAVIELGYPLISGLWADDWQSNITPETIFERIVPNVEDGTIIGLHDGSGNRATAEAIGDILDALIEEGFQFLTLAELFELRGATIEPGIIYYYVR